MATRKAASGAARRSSRRLDPDTFRARFLRIALRKRIEEGQEIAEIPPDEPGSIFLSFRHVVTRLRLYLWCRDVERILDSTSQFIRDYGKNLTAAEKDALEKSMAELLDAYAENC